MNSQFIIPIHPLLQQYVKGFWETEGNPGHQRETILPKGVIELIFSFGEPLPFRRSEGAIVSDTPRCFITGISDIPIHLQVPKHQSFFGVILHPAGVKRLLAAPAGLFINAITDLTLIDKKFTRLWERLAEAKNFEDKKNIAAQYILSDLLATKGYDDRFSGFLESAAVPASVKEMAQLAYCSPRQVNRKAHEYFGLPAEALIRYKKYLAALQLVHHTAMPLTHVAYEAGYHDQAHFIRVFREYTNLTPGAYRKTKSHMPGHLYQ